MGNLPASSATARAIHGPDTQWGLTEQLLAAAVDALRAANWQRAGDKRARRPDPLERPGVEKTRRGNARMTPQQLQRRLARLRR